MSEQEPQRKKGGRPRKHAPEARRPTMAFRMGSQLHEKLIASSTENERSLSEEIERRLEDSYNNPCIGNDRTAKLLRHVGITISMVESSCERRWWDDEFTASLCGEILQKIVGATFPERPAAKNMLLEAMRNDAENTLEKAQEKYWNSAAALYASNTAISILENKPDE